MHGLIFEPDPPLGWAPPRLRPWRGLCKDRPLWALRVHGVDKQVGEPPPVEARSQISMNRDRNATLSVYNAQIPRIMRPSPVKLIPGRQTIKKKRQRLLSLSLHPRRRSTTLSPSSPLSHSPTTTTLSNHVCGLLLCCGVLLLVVAGCCWLWLVPESVRDSESARQRMGKLEVENAGAFCILQGLLHLQSLEGQCSPQGPNAESPLHHLPFFLSTFATCSPSSTSRTLSPTALWPKFQIKECTAFCTCRVWRIMCEGPAKPTVHSWDRMEHCTTTLSGSNCNR